jgi:hypothetical protein
LTERSDGQLVYALAHPRADGATHLLLDPRELLEKLCALVPAPRTHLLRDHGMLAPDAAWRSLIVPSGGAVGPGRRRRRTRSSARELVTCARGPRAVVVGHLAQAVWAFSLALSTVSAAAAVSGAAATSAIKIAAGVVVVPYHNSPILLTHGLNVTDPPAHWT